MISNSMNEIDEYIPGILIATDDVHVPVGASGRRRTAERSSPPHHIWKIELDANPHLALVDVNEGDLARIVVGRTLAAEDEHVVVHGNGAVQEPSRRQIVFGLSLPPPSVSGYRHREGLRGRRQIEPSSGGVVEGAKEVCRLWSKQILHRKWTFIWMHLGK